MYADLLAHFLPWELCLKIEEMAFDKDKQAHRDKFKHCLNSIKHNLIWVYDKDDVNQYSFLISDRPNPYRVLVSEDPWSSK